MDGAWHTILFDKVATLSQNEAVTVTARAENWLLIQTATNQTAWIAADLVDLPVDLLAMIPPAPSIPMPPPPLIAQTTVSELNMRDGPGTGYHRMTRLDVGTSVDLLSRFGTWLQVQTADGMQGWVDTTYLSMQPGVMDRVPETSDVPPLDPALRGTVAETGINLRNGPGTTYPSLGKLKAGTPLSMLARYDTWYQVQTPDAATGWVASDLLAVSEFIHRRIPITNDIPSLPIPAATRPKTVPSNDSAWVWPTTGRLTSPFGWRVLNCQGQLTFGSVGNLVIEIESRARRRWRSKSSFA